MNIFLDSIIYDTAFEDFRFQVEATTDKQIDVYIASVGGNVDAGFAIANYIEAVNASGEKTITTNILSNADSIATVIALAPELSKRSIVESSTMFIHNPRFMELCDVTSDKADKASEMLKVMEDRLATYYTRKIPNLTIEDAKGLMAGEVTLDADTMIQYGVMGNKLESFSIAAFKQKSDYMSLFKKEKPLFNIALGEVQAIHEGDLAVGTELRAIGSMDAINGTFAVAGKNVKVENSKVVNLEPIPEVMPDPKEEEELPFDMAEVEAKVEEKLEPIFNMVEKVMAMVEKMSGQSSTHKPAKTTVNNQVVSDDPQKEARKASFARQKANAQKQAEAIEARINKINIV